MIVGRGADHRIVGRVWRLSLGESVSRVRFRASSREWLVEAILNVVRASLRFIEAEIHLLQRSWGGKGKIGMYGVSKVWIFER